MKEVLVDATPKQSAWLVRVYIEVKGKLVIRQNPLVYHSLEERLNDIERQGLEA